MTTFSDIQTAVEGNLIDLPTFVADSVPGLINRAYRKAMKLRNFWVMRAEQDYVTVAETRLLGAVPTDWKEWRGKPYHIENTGAKRRMVLATNLDQARAMWDADDVSEPEGLAETLAVAAGTSSLNVYPLPDGNSDYPDGEYRITVPYFKYLPALSGPTDQTWLTDEGEAYLEAEATKYGFAKDWDEDRSTYWEGQARREWKDLVLQDKYKWLSMNETMAVHDGPYELSGD